LYYVHYSVSTFGSQTSQIGVATATSLSGPWTDHGSLNLPQSSAYNLIDPFVFQDGNALYFTFGSYWSGIQQFAVASSLSAVDGSIASGGDIKPIVTNSSAGASVVEGGTMYKHDGVAVCRADAVVGPFVDREGRSCQTQNGGTVILASHGDVYAPGGQGVMRLPEGRDIIYYHYGMLTVELRHRFCD
jgi:arabinan endo-1,5-alpha-L-arabinosidase